MFLFGVLWSLPLKEASVPQNKQKTDKNYFRRKTWFVTFSFKIENMLEQQQA